MAIESEISKGLIPESSVNGNGVYSVNGRGKNFSDHIGYIAVMQTYGKEIKLPEVSQELIDSGVNGITQLRIVREIDKGRVEIAEGQRKANGGQKAK